MILSNTRQSGAGNKTNGYRRVGKYMADLYKPLCLEWVPCASFGMAQRCLTGKALVDVAGQLRRATFVVEWLCRTAHVRPSGQRSRVLSCRQGPKQLPQRYKVGGLAIWSTSSECTGSSRNVNQNYCHDQHDAHGRARTVMFQWEL